MKLIKCLVLAAALLWSPGLSGSSVQDASQPKAPEQKAKTSLIRKDLLRKEGSEPRLPKRNIFSSRSSFSSSLTPSSQALPRPLVPTGEEGDIPSEEETKGPPPVIINLRYIGYIESPRKMIALVILEGEALAVAADEMIGEGFKVGKITPLEIEIVLPDSTTRKFSLEKGE